MSKKSANTPSGDRKRDRAARQRRPPRKPLDGNHIRVRAKHLDDVDPDRLALAYWLLAMRLVEDETDPRELTESEVGAVLAELEGSPPADGSAGSASPVHHRDDDAEPSR